jgi:ADP-heptose:LPS heptosyltransferase
LIERGTFRSRRKFALAVAADALAPLLRFSAHALCHRPSLPPKEWKKALILGHNHIGDVLYRTCSLPELHRGLPNCELHYLTGSAGAEILEGNPALDRILPWQSRENSWQLSRTHFKSLRDERFDAVLCTNSVRYYPDLMLACALNIPTRVAFIHKGLAGLVTLPVRARYPSPFPEYFRDMVGHVTGLAPTWELRPTLYPTDVDRTAARAQLKRLRRDGKPLLACTPFSRQPGSWPLEHFALTIRHILALGTFDVVLCGSASDGERLDAFRSQIGATAAILAGELNIRAFAAFLEGCAGLVAVDSGPRHVGNAAGVPVFFFRTLTFTREEAGSYCSTEIDLAPPDELLRVNDVPEAAGQISPMTVATRIDATLRQGPGASTFRTRL